MNDISRSLPLLLVVFGLICASVGWCVIEVLIWFFSNFEWVG